MVVEVKSNREKEGYERNKQEYKGKAENLFSEVFAKEIGFKAGLFNSITTYRKLALFQDS